MFGVSSHKNPIARGRCHLQKHQVIGIRQNRFQKDGNDEVLILQNLQNCPFFPSAITPARIPDPQYRTVDQ